jgi:hypothetical protein
MSYGRPSSYNTFNSQGTVDEGRKPKFGEQSFVASIRLPVSVRDDYNQVKGSHDMASEVRNILNRLSDK